MRPLTALAAGLIATLTAGTVIAADVPAATRDAPALIGSAGAFAILDDFGAPLLLGLQYRGRPCTRLDLRPGIGLLYGEDGQSYLFADLAHDWQLSDRWVATLSFGFGWFNNGDDIEVVDAREFQTVLALSRRLTNGGRVGISGSHISNGGLSSPNRGTETLALFYAFPVGWGK
jgi:hypothetical protein